MKHEDPENSASGVGRLFEGERHQDPETGTENGPATNATTNRTTEEQRQGPLEAEETNYFHVQSPAARGVSVTEGSRTLAVQKTCLAVTYSSKNKAVVGCDMRHAYVFSCLSCLCDGVFQTQTFSLDGTLDLC
ncbi:hypothetical protein ILYODFUR_012551 [Ilyodon furcidens]|uniref:Uncharacterized protein n=1 Tax=Ilyodon furcidens TaxID=33524 RepID=A0ABV0U8S2_9TELE